MKAKQDGWNAFFSGHTKSDCPFAAGDFKRTAWMKGRAAAIKHWSCNGIMDKGTWPKRKVSP